MDPISLSNEKLDLKTFVFAYHNIVWEKHFGEDCFEEDLEEEFISIFLSICYICVLFPNDLFLDKI